MNISDKILNIIQEHLPYSDEDSSEYYEISDNIHTKIMELIPTKKRLTSDSEIFPNTPMWVWTDSKDAVLVNFRTDYPEKLFWPIEDGDYINNSRAIPFNKVTHFMLIENPNHKNF